MNTKLSRIAAFSGLLLGAFALSAAAAGFWTPAPANPPSNNTDAPINVGSEAQVKVGGLGIGGSVGTGMLFNVLGTGVINKFITNSFTLIDNTPGDDNGKVLKSNANGEAYWAALNGGEGGGEGEVIYAAGSFDLNKGGATCESCVITVTLPANLFTEAPIIMTQPMWSKFSGDEDVAWWVPEVTSTYFKVKYHTPTEEGQVYGPRNVMWFAIARTQSNVSAPVQVPLQL